VKAATGEPAGLRTHAIHAIVLVLLAGLLYATTRAVPGIHGSGGTIAAIGFLLLAGTLASELVEPLGLPHLSGYIGASSRGRTSSISWITTRSRISRASTTWRSR
jgi:hypothetical protein